MTRIRGASQRCTALASAVVCVAAWTANAWHVATERHHDHALGEPQGHRHDEARRHPHAEDPGPRQGHDGGGAHLEREADGSGHHADEHAQGPATRPPGSRFALEPLPLAPALAFLEGRPPRQPPPLEPDEEPPDSRPPPSPRRPRAPPAA